MKMCNISVFFFKCRTKSPKFFSLRAPLNFGTFATYRLDHCTEVNNPNKALRVLDLVSPKATRGQNQKIHLQLIQDFLQTRSKKSCEKESSKGLVVAEDKSRYDVGLSFMSYDEDPILGVSELHRRGLSIGCAVISRALSACGSRGDLYYGRQLHCLGTRDGLCTNVYVGSSLISLYSKCGDLRSARLLFEEMPVRNVVSWTALISGFAQECQVDVCLKLYQGMRNSYLNPNDYTVTSLLSACVGGGSLRHGRRIHSQAIVFGVDLYIHVANALISMYCKCGDIEGALCVFEAMDFRDVVSWNSLIAGYALHGLALKAINFFEEMGKHNMKPDGITFLGVLSSCRHAGLVNQGQMYFNSMIENGVKPDLGHYSCIVDLLGRAGLVEEAWKFVLDMPIKPNAVIWGSLLSSCRLHNNIWIGIEAAENRLLLEPSCASTHVQLAKLYARVGLWDQVAKVWKMMKDTERKTEPGYSWIEIGNEVHRFRVDDTANSRMSDVLFMLDFLMGQLTSDHVAEIFDDFDDDLCNLAL